MSARIHLRNLAFNWGGHAATLIVLFFLSPYIVGKLDSVSYGIWSLLNVLTGYMGIFDLGVRASVGRHVALYLGKKDSVGVDETIRAGFGFFSLSGLLILVVGILLGLVFPSVFQGVPQEHYNTVRLLLLFMVINVWLSAIAAIYSSVIVSYDRFDIARGIDMMVLLVRTVGTIYTLQIGLGLWGLALSLILGNVCAVVLNRIYAAKIHPALRSFPFSYSRLRLKELFGYGIPAFVSQTSIKIIGQSDLIIVGIFLSVSDVREYSIGAMLVYYSATFISLIGNTFFPTVQRTVSGGTLGEVRHLFYRQLRVTLCFGLLIYIGFVFYSEPFISLWMLQDGFDQAAVNAAAGVMTILALSKIPTLFIHPSTIVLSSMGYVGFTAKVKVIEALINLPLSITLVKLFDYGIAGVAAGTLSARLLIPSIILPYYLLKKLNISRIQFIKSVVLSVLVSSFLFSMICWVIVHYWKPESWFSFGSQIILSLILWGIIGTTLLLTKDLKDRCLVGFSKKIKTFF